QTMNPSTAEMLAAVKATPAKNVFIIPNNKNIIMSAEQVIPLVTDRKVVVLPTRTIAQGLSALLAYDPSAAMEANTVGMMEAASAVTTGNVTFAARDSEFGGRKIHRGDIMGLVDGKLELVEKDNDIVRACVRLTRSMINRGTAFITLLYGEGVTEQMANEAYGKIKARAGENVEVTLVKGGQPVYYFIISVE
ncbi:MAG TPA: dihydroxyacetone kinase, partial [Ruminococcaceae bacterium]|nr:dihydroxyacetone kinase [Oscillospiraceae bacterium]